VGCNFDLNVRDGKVVKVTSAWDAPANKGVLCVKGRFGWQFLHHPDRLTTPLMKASLWKDLKGTDGTPSPYKDFVEIDWDTALDTVADRLSAIKSANGPDVLAILTSAKCTNEENYLLQKLARKEIGTNNIDHCARL